MTAGEIIRPRLSLLGPKRVLVLRGLVWAGLGVLVLLVLLYGRLLFGPISLGFLSDRVKGAIAGVVEENYTVDWGDFGLSLTGPLSIGFHLSDVTLTERATDAEIRMEALEIALSPIGMAFGRPEARVILIGPQFYMLQDLMGPRLSRFEFIEDDEGGTTVRIIEGERSVPTVRIGDDGLWLPGRGREIGLRSDNDWLVLNMEALDAALAGVAEQAMAGQVTRIEIRDGSVGVLDTVYGLYKSFDAVDFEVRSGREDGRVSALFSAEIAGKTMEGTIVRRIEEGAARIDAEVANLDFSTIIPFLDDADGLAALRGTGQLRLAVEFEPGESAVASGAFAVDLSGTDLRLNNDLFAVRAEPFTVEWFPNEARFSVAEAEVGIGQSRGTISGDIVMGFDAQFGPTLGMSIRARDVWLVPDDMEPPAEPFEEFTFEGWSAPLYGALGIDRMVGAKEGVSVVMQGRIDMVREGVGLDVTVSGRGASADDVKRLWPYLFAREGREWFTQYVLEGSVATADLRFRFPVGSIAMEGQGGRVPEGAMTIDVVGDGVQLKPFEGLPEFQVAGAARVAVRDNQLTMAFERARLPEAGGDIAIANAAFINQDTSAREQVFEISGDIAGSVPAVLRLANSETLNLFEDFQFGLDPDALAGSLSGQVETTVIATIATDDTGVLVGTDYALNGTVSGMGSTAPIMGLSFADGGFSFTASQEGFRVLGRAGVGEADIEVQAIKTRGSEPDILIGSTFTAADLAAFGIDLSEFMGGTARVVAKPLPDGRIGISADLTDTALTIRDIGIAKARGVSGGLTATVTLGEEAIAVEDVELGFGTVRLAGDIGFTPEGRLVSADFSTFRVSPGDSARVAMAPISGGFSLAIEGEQLDIKPVLKRFFNLEGDASAGASADLQDQIFDVSVNLDRALGYYGEAAFNVELDLSVRGDQLRHFNLAAQLGGNRSASATTNPLPSGRLISYATNDLGATLRFIGIYPRLVGGEGSMVMRYDEEAGADAGAFEVRNFAVVDENNLDAIIGTHDESRGVVGGASGIEFDYGKAEFIRYRDRIEVLDAAVYGDLVGGTIRGNIITQTGRYDLAGTYVPLFGLNNFFQQIPIFGPIFGGREGEGLIGVTFAVRGPLNQPELFINPVSILAPGVFRTLFEYRAANQPVAAPQE